MAVSGLRLAYYVSGHGFGHATRVSAVIEALLKFDSSIQVCIVSTAPVHVFNCLKKGATYRYAEIDPVIVQPVAYAVDRRQSLKVLKDFLAMRERKLAEEARWLMDNHINCVLSDAVFIACAAANLACIPSALITNFTFDSNWSWLASDIPNDTPWAMVHNRPDMHHLMEGIPDDPAAYEPLQESELAPLVEQMMKDYSSADTLFLLPGAIPFPSFSADTPLPATEWVSADTKSFSSDILNVLKQYREYPEHVNLYPVVPFQSGVPPLRSRRIVPAPLIVRHPSKEAFTETKRDQLLDWIGVPTHFRDRTKTHILIVSFGGQKFRRPGSGSATPSAVSSPESKAVLNAPILPPEIPLLENPVKTAGRSSSEFRYPHRSSTTLHPPNLYIGSRPRGMSAPPRIVTPTHLFIPGAPGPIPNPASPIIGSGTSAWDYSPRSPETMEPLTEEQAPQLLPPGWIAVICGGSPNWDNEEHLPSDLFIAPRDIHMPDLMVIGDVLLGKLGYGTVSEAIDSGTPFMYVPRPAICEEMGLKLLLEQNGVGVEISREMYESGNWADLVEEAWAKGQGAKEKRRALGVTGIDQRMKEMDNFASTLANWLHNQLESPAQPRPSDGNICETPIIERARGMAQSNA